MVHQKHVKQSLKDMQSGKAVIIDVREPAEFKAKHIKGAINIPSTQWNIALIEPYRNKEIDLVCQSGNRAVKMYHYLELAGYKHLSVLYEQMNDIKGIRLEQRIWSWSIDRQFRLVLGLLLLLFIVGHSFISSYFFIIPIVLCIGLIITAWMDTCYMRTLIAQLPWNKGKSI